MTGPTAAIDRDVRLLYERRPYPPPPADLDAYRDGRRTVDGSPRFHGRVYWPKGDVRGDLDILVAGCGTSQAAKIAVQHPAVRVTAIDICVRSLECTETLARRSGLDNLEVRQLSIECVRELRRSFDLVMCTGVLHHLQDPDEGLRALTDVVRPEGALYLMVYARYGRAGVSMMQEYCRRLDLDAGADDATLRELAVLARGLPDHHPLQAFARSGNDLTHLAGLADALLHPRDRAYSVPEIYGWLERCDLRLVRWFLQAPYRPDCGFPARSPHAARLAALPAADGHAAVELLRGTIITHRVVACRRDRPIDDHAIDFGGEAWRDWVPSNFHGSRLVRDGAPSGAVAVLRHRHHRDADLDLPLTPAEAALWAAIDGQRTIGELAHHAAGGADPGRLAAFTRALFQRLWHHDHVLFRTG